MRYLVLMIVFAALFAQPCCALDAQQRMVEELNPEQIERSLPEELGELLSEYDLTTGAGLKQTVQRLWDKGREALLSHLEQAWKPAFYVLLVSVLCSLSAAMLPGNQRQFPVTLSGGGAIVFLTLLDTQSFFADCIEAVRELYEFSTALLPCIATASAFTGASVSAGVKYTAGALFMNILLNFSNTVLVPVITLYLICIVGNSLFEQKVLGAVSNFIRWGCTTLLTGSVVVFTSYLSIAGLLTSTTDLLTARVTKTALSAGLPVVGRIISDTASTLVAGAAVLRNGIGVLGMLGILGILLIPFASLGIRYLLFKAVGELSDIFPNHGFSGLIRGIASAYGMLLGVIGTGFIMLFLTLISFMQLGGGG